MKTSIRIASIAIVFLAIAFSCSKDKTITPLAMTNGTLLAGANGQSKTWKIVSVTEVDSLNASASVIASLGYINPDKTTYSQADNSIPACVSDNVYTFSNNSTQDYQLAEGATEGTAMLCSQSDIFLIETGNWAFTDDGKNLLIDANDNSLYSDTTEVKEIFNSNGSVESFMAYYYPLSSYNNAWGGPYDSAFNVKQITATSMTLIYSRTTPQIYDSNGDMIVDSKGNPIPYTLKITLVFSSGS